MDGDTEKKAINPKDIGKIVDVLNLPGSAVNPPREEGEKLFEDAKAKMQLIKARKALEKKITAGEI